MIRIRMQGFDKMRSYTENLPKKVEMEFERENDRFVNNVVSVAKDIAPVDTGLLKSSIKKEPVRKAKNVKKWAVVVEAPYGSFQEFGFTPHYAFIRNSSKLAPGRYFVSKYTPFIKPAVIAVYQSYLNSLTLASRRALAN